jgi:O-antigen ligase
VTERRFAQLPELLAVVGLVPLLVLVPLIAGDGSARVKIGPIPLEILTFAVPIAILFAIPLFRSLGASRMPRFGFELAALFFLGFALLSIAFSQGSIGTWVRYAGYVAIVPTVAAVTRKDGNRRVVLWLLVAAGAITALLGVLQYLNPTTIKAIGLQGLDESVKTRIYGTYSNPNFYAEYLILLISATLALTFEEKGLLRGVAAALMGLEAVALLLTFTRGSWLALVIGLIVAITMVDARYLWGLFGAAVLAMVASAGIRQRVLSIFSLEGTASFRLRLWRLAGTIIKQHPWVGVGIGKFIDAFKQVSVQHPELGTGFLVYGAHNSYFTLSAETGIIGGLAFAFLILSVCKMGVFYGTRMAGDMSARLRNAALTVGIVAFAFNALTSNSFQHPQAAVFFFVLAGLQAGLGWRFWNMPAEEHEPARVPAKQAAGLVSGSIVVRGALRLAHGMQELWAGSELRHWLVSAPLGDGNVYRRSWLARLLLGKGSDTAEADAV